MAQWEGPHLGLWHCRRGGKGGANTGSIRIEFTFSFLSIFSHFISCYFCNRKASNKGQKLGKWNMWWFSWFMNILLVHHFFPQRGRSPLLQSSENENSVSCLSLSSPSLKTNWPATQLLMLQPFPGPQSLLACLLSQLRGARMLTGPDDLLRSPLCKAFHPLTRPWTLEWQFLPKLLRGHC